MVAQKKPGELPDPFGHRVLNVLGVDGAERWSQREQEAYIAFLRVSMRVKVLQDVALLEKHDLTMGMVGILGQLSWDPGRPMRMSDLAKAVGLSVSRISRLVGVLEKRQLIKKVASATDARVTETLLTSVGQNVIKDAQETVRKAVEAGFVGPLRVAGTKKLIDVLLSMLAIIPAASELADFDDIEDLDAPSARRRIRT